MNKIFFFISIFIFLCQNIHAQYIPMLKDGAEWYGYHNFENFRYNSRTVVAGDTLLNGKLYKKIDYYFNSEFMESLFWREDSIEQKVYKYSEGFDDSVAFDFSVEPGDTLFYGGFNLPLDSITDYYYSSIQYGYTYNLPKGTRVFYFPYGKIYIEGIGDHLTGLINGEQMVCHFNANGVKDASTDYSYLGFPIVDCKGDISMSSSNIGNSSLVFHLTPNPCQLNLHITLDESQGRKKIALFDIVGNKIADYSFIGLEYDIDIMYLPKGIYFIQIVLDGELIGVKKFVKE